MGYFIEKLFKTSGSLAIAPDVEHINHLAPPTDIGITTICPRLFDRIVSNALKSPAVRHVFDKKLGKRFVCIEQGELTRTTQLFNVKPFVGQTPGDIFQCGLVATITIASFFNKP